MEDHIPHQGPGTTPAGPDRRIVYGVIAVAVVILAAILIANSVFGISLVNPEGGQMSLVRPQVTPIERVTIPTSIPTIIPTTRNLGVAVVTHSFGPTHTPLPKLCRDGTTGCNGTCVDENTDTQNCGSCGNDCSKLPNVRAASCVDGKCVISQCSKPLYPYTDCDKNPLNGCEILVCSDANNCGACGVRCTGTTPYCDCGACHTQQEHDLGGKEINGVVYPFDCTVCF